MDRKRRVLVYAVLLGLILILLIFTISSSFSNFWKGVTSRVVGPCEPLCSGKDCGPDGCGGSCPPGCDPGEMCLNGHCICVPDCDDKECGDDGCGGSCGTCDSNEKCQNGICTGTCIPNCLGKECGPDGCDSICGICNFDEYCFDGVCLTKCEVNCLGKECGPDNCGGSCPPGCDPGYTCENGDCVFDCIPECWGRECGPDPICGDSCGTCGKNEYCLGGYCVLGNCTPDCTGRACGPDPICSQSCGECDPGEDCVVGTCIPGPSCDIPPFCEDIECGNNGCGQSCGICEIGKSCVNGICLPESICVPACSPEEICINEVCVPNICFPDCSGKLCGNDGCGGFCGVCGVQEYCKDNVCVSFEKGTCVDNDVTSEFPDGININLRGNTKTTQEEFFDECLNTNLLEEFYCENNAVSEVLQECEAGCLYGACVQEQYYGCYRTDEGDLEVKGSVCLYQENSQKQTCFAEDFCGIGAGSLSQTECISDSEFREVWYGCLLGCRNGACIAPKEVRFSEAACVRNFECDSGLCVDGKCLERDNLEKAILWVGNLFS